MGAAERLPEFRQPGKVYDELGRQVARNPWRGTPGLVFLLRLPGFAAQFRHEVPAAFVVRVLAEGEAVACRCGGLVAIAYGELVECSGGCGRWFLRTEESVRVAKWAAAAESAAA